MSDTTSDFKSTALTHIHEQLGAKMVPFAGYLMPVQYEGVNAEHEIVRKGVGVFDVSHMGEFLLKGPNALDLIQRVTSNDASKLFDGRAQYTCLPNETGGIVDDLLVYRISDEEYLLVVNASNIEKDWNWISKYNTKGVVMENISDNMALLAVQGPKATEALQKLTDVNLLEITKINEKLLREGDPLIRISNPIRIEEATGWSVEISFDNMIKKIIKNM